MFESFKFYYLCVSMYMYMCTPVPTEAKRGYPLELELQAVLSHTIWVQGTKLWFSGREASALDSVRGPGK